MSAIEGFFDVPELNRFRRIVTDAARCAQKNHCDGNFFREDHGIVARTAGHPVRLTTSASNGLFDLIGQELIHGDRSLVEKRSPLQGSTARGSNCFGPPYQIIQRLGADVRSEERRVGKECRSRWSPYH